MQMKLKQFDEETRQSDAKKKLDVRERDHLCPTTTDTTTMMMVAGQRKNTNKF
jgi:hypothetical protein